MAGIAAVAYEDWTQIFSRFTRVDNGWNVRLWNAKATPARWETHFVSEELGRGFDMTQLSGDVDSAGNAEIWPIVLEQAYAHMLGNGNVDAGYGIIETMNGGDASYLYTALTGKPPREAISTSGRTNAEIAAEIDAGLDNSKQVVLNTKSELPANSPVHRNHSFLVLGRIMIDTDADGVGDAPGYRLYDPWGGILILPVSMLSDNLSSIEILDSLN